MRPCSAIAAQPGLLGDPSRVQVGQVVLVDALAGLHRHRHVVRRRRRDRRVEDRASRSRFHGSAPPPPLRVTLGTGQPKFRSTCAHAVLLAEDPRGRADVRRVGAVELDRPDVLAAGRRPASPGDLVPLDQPAGGDHLADVEPGALLTAQPAVGRVGDAGHRSEHDRGLDDEGPQGERGLQRTRWRSRASWLHCRLSRGGTASPGTTTSRIAGDLGRPARTCRRAGEHTTDAATVRVRAVRAE